jgi:hypothetical protein
MKPILWRGYRAVLLSTDSALHGGNSRLGTDVLELAGKVVALAAALMPAGGLVIRFVAFQFAFGDIWSGWPLVIAWSAPLPQLIATGVIVLGPFAIVTVFMAVIASTRARLAHQQTRQQRSPRHYVAIVVGSAMVLAGMVFGVQFVGEVVAVAALLVFTYGIEVAQRNYKSVQLRHVWFTTVVSLGLMATAGGLVGIAPVLSRANYAFVNAMGTSAADGQYQELGHSDGILYLQKCGTNQVVAVPTNNVLVAIPVADSAGLGHIFEGSLWALFQGKGTRLGLSLC